MTLPVVGAAPRELLKQEIDALTGRGTLVRAHEDGRLECVACAHRCLLKEEQRGICGVRFRAGGELRVPFGYVARTYVRSVETNTIFHVMPGAKALTFGLFGCDMACGYCHNARVSQALRVGAAPDHPIVVSADDLAERAVAEGCAVLCAAYNEPMIASEWNYAVFEAAKRRGLVTAIVSDGHTTEEALAFMRPVTDVFRVDLKAATEDRYRELGGSLAPVWSAIEHARALGFWVEVVTLVVPGFNDDVAGLRSLGKRLAAIDPDLPWHVNGFKPRFRMRDRPETTGMPLVSAAGSGLASGLRYVYVSNVIGAEELGKTRCTGCGDVLVERYDFAVTRLSLAPGGVCPRCTTRMPGVFAPSVAAVEHQAGEQ